MKVRPTRDVFTEGGVMLTGQDYEVQPAQIYFDVVEDHYEYRHGWRGVIDRLLRRKPLRVIDKVDVKGVRYGYPPE